MSSIASLQLTTPVGGQTTYTSPVTDLLRHNSMAYSAFYSHASLLVCQMKMFFSTDGIDFTEYKTITLDNDIRSTGNELIPSRYFKFEVINLDLNAMSLVDVFFTAFVNATSNINVNVGEGDFIDISGGATEVTQLLINDNLTRVVPSNNAVLEAIPVRLMVGHSGSAFNALRAIGQDLAVHITDMETDAVINSGIASKALQESTKVVLDNVETKLGEIDSVLDAMKLDTAKLISAPSTEAKQDDGITKLGEINDNLTRVVPTNNSVAEAIPVRLMVGHSGSAFNALRAIGQDLAVHITDMETDAVINSGIASKALQESTKVVLDDIENGLNLGRISNTIYTGASVTAFAFSTSIIMGNGKDRYSQIQVIGDSGTALYKFIIEYSIDDVNWFSDGVENDTYTNAGRYQFSVSRINISVPYVRILSTVTGATVNMNYSLTK